MGRSLLLCLLLLASSLPALENALGTGIGVFSRAEDRLLVAIFRPDGGLAKLSIHFPDGKKVDVSDGQQADVLVTVEMNSGRPSKFRTHDTTVGSGLVVTGDGKRLSRASVPLAVTFEGPRAVEGFFSYNVENVASVCAIDFDQITLEGAAALVKAGIIHASVSSASPVNALP